MSFVSDTETGPGKEGGYSTKSYTGNPTPRSNPLPFYKPFWKTFYKQIVPNSLSFHILQLVKSLPFHIPETWKKALLSVRVSPYRPLKGETLGNWLTCAKLYSKYMRDQRDRPFCNRRERCFTHRMEGKMECLESFPFSKSSFCFLWNLSWDYLTETLLTGFKFLQPLCLKYSALG